MKLKIGDKVICKKACIMKFSNQITTTVGKAYEIIRFNDYQFIIYDDQEEEHYFLIDNEYFSMLKYKRKEKLIKLENEGY